MALIQKNFPASMFPEAKLVFKEIKDPGTTGNFEIKVNGELVHSHRTKDHGFLEEDKSQQKVVFAKIELIIDD